MKQKLLYLLLMAALFVTAQAETIDAQKKQISSIKKSDKYLYGEAVAATTEDARQLAKELLENEIRQYVAQEKKLQGESIVVSNRQEAQMSIELPRGNMFRSFIYVRKSDIIASDDVEVIAADSLEKGWPEAVTVIAGYTDYYEMAERLKQLKAEGKVGYYGRYANLENPDIYYMVVYNPEGKVVAVLSPGPTRTNVKTGQTQKLTDFSGCGAIGFSAK